MSIRTRLLLLVFAVWLPAMAGFGLLARATYVHEARTALEHVRDSARALSLVIDREIDKHAALARALGASKALHDDDLERFYADARGATEGTQDTVILVDGREQALNTRLPFGESLSPRAWHPSRLVEAGEPVVTDLRPRQSDGHPVLVVLAPETGHPAHPYDVGVVFFPDAVQAALDQQRLPEGVVASVLDSRFQTVARSRDPARWLGTPAAPPTVSAARRGDGDFESQTREGEPTVGYVAHSQRYGWMFAVGLPRSILNRSALRVTLQAFTAALVLAAIGLVAALAFARRISEPVLALSAAAAELGRDRVPAPLATGLAEADRVGAALHEAGRRQAHATEELEARVADAVRRTEEAQTRLLDGQKHEAIGRLTGGLAHDLNNFLQTMSTGLQVLDHLVHEAPGRRVIEASTRAVDKAATLVRQMLAFGRTQPLKPQPVDLHDFVLHCEELMTRAVGSHVRLTADIEPNLPPVLVDPTQFELALLNLVFNARDAMPQGGTVILRGRRAAEAQAMALPPGRFIAVEVVDTGMGMEAGVLQRVFEPYFTTKAVGVGSGLGLPQVRAFAVQSGGTATIRSERGAGTTVSLLLPVSSAPVPAASSGRSHAVFSTPLRVLFVEDDLLVSSVVVPALQAAGHAVRHCLGAEPAIQALQEGPLFDVVFTDIVMPGSLNGLDLARWVAQHTPAIAIVVSTGYTTQHIDPAIKVLAKPYSMDAMLAELQLAVRSRRGG
jgi:signal transduction histidine kinase